MTLLFFIYIFFGILAFFYEWANGSSWKFAAFIGVFYPVTMVAGGVGWIGYGVYYLASSGFKGAQRLWSSRLFQRVLSGPKK